MDLQLIEIDGYKFSYESSDTSYHYYERKEVAIIKQNGLEYRLTLRPYIYDRNKNLIINSCATIESYNKGLKHIDIPHHLIHRDREYPITSVGNDCKLFQNDMAIESLTIGAPFNDMVAEKSRNLFLGCTNIKEVEILKGGNSNILLATKYALSKENLSKSSNVIIPDSILICPREVSQKNTDTKYGLKTDIYKTTGFFFENGQHIRALSVSSRFWLGFKAFLQIEKRYVYHKKGEQCKDVVRPTSIHTIIIREDPSDVWDFYTIPTYDMELMKKAFSNITLYIHSKHLKVIDAKIGANVFKAIKTFEELPEEYKDLLVDPESKPAPIEEKKIMTKEVPTIDLEKLISAAMVDGVVTDKERAILIKKVKEAGGDTDEFEMLLDARIYEAQQTTAATKPKSKSETSIAHESKVSSNQTSDIGEIKLSAEYGIWKAIRTVDNKSLIYKNGQLCDKASPALREIAQEIGFTIDPEWRTSQLCVNVIKAMQKAK